MKGRDNIACHPCCSMIYVGGRFGCILLDREARFAIAVMDGGYISRKTLCGEVLKEYSEDRHGPIGLGWYCTGLDTPDLAGYHAGSNGHPRAFIAIKPHSRNVVALTGLNRSEKGAHDFGKLTIDLMAIVENRSTPEGQSTD